MLDPSASGEHPRVKALRTAVHAVPGARALVGGRTAIQLDTKTAADHDNKLVIPLILVVVFRTLLVPALSLDVERRIWWPSALARGSAGAPTNPAVPKRTHA